jgi:hypothetical protein
MGITTRSCIPPLATPISLTRPSRKGSPSRWNWPNWRRLATLGGSFRRLVRGPPWRDPVLLLTVSQDSWQFAPPSIFE